MKNEALVSWVDYAVEVAMMSPCQSKRGVIIADKDGDIVAGAFNHQPAPFICDSSDTCKKACGKTAVHAEQAAIITARTDLRGGWMLHVKARDGKPCASTAPSCLECSKLILESGIAWMHLLHEPRAQMLPGAEVVRQVEGWTTDGLGMLDIRRYTAEQFHRLTAEWWHRISLLAASTPAPAEPTGGSR